MLYVVQKVLFFCSISEYKAAKSLMDRPAYVPLKAEQSCIMLSIFEELSRELGDGSITKLCESIG